MPQPSSKTPQRVAKMLALHSKGGSAREIADELGVNHGTIIRWLEEAGLRPNGGHGTRKKRERSPLNGAAGEMLEKQKRLAEMEMPAPSTDVPTMLAGMHHELAEARAFIRFHREGAKAGTSSMADLDRAMVIAERLATRIAELTPPAGTDPEADPSNMRAAAEVRAKFMALVEAAERSAKCVACGRNPHGREIGK